jgi:hypothetical protein
VATVELLKPLFVVVKTGVPVAAPLFVALMTVVSPAVPMAAPTAAQELAVTLFIMVGMVVVFPPVL